MKIHLSVENPTAEFQHKLLALLAEHAAHVQPDTTWNVERAARFYLSLPPRAQRIVFEAVAKGGYVSADDLRAGVDASLRGHSAALTRALQRGEVKGWWPHEMTPPIVADGPGFGKVVGYRMPKDLVDIFGAAIHQAQAPE